MNSDVYKIREKRKKYALNKLGGKCIKCGSIDNLHFDHIDFKTKTANISSMYTYRIEKLDKELAKCQLLCAEYHKKKTKADGNITVAWNKGKWKHGTLTGYIHKKCKCDKCSKFYSEYRKNKRNKGVYASGSKQAVCNTAP